MIDRRTSQAPGRPGTGTSAALARSRVAESANVTTSGRLAAFEKIERRLAALRES